MKNIQKGGMLLNKYDDDDAQNPVHIKDLIILMSVYTLIEIGD